MTMYRLVFKDGRVGAWSSDKEKMEEEAKFWYGLAVVETKEF